MPVEQAPNPPYPYPPNDPIPCIEEVPLTEAPAEEQPDPDEHEKEGA